MFWPLSAPNNFVVYGQKYKVWVLVSHILNISLCKTCDPKWGHFQPHGHNLNKLGRGPLVMLHTKYQGPMLCGFKQEDFCMFCLYYPM